jgi:hypothetical protein
MRKAASIFMAGVLGAGLLVTAPAAHAGDTDQGSADLSGRWRSVALRTTDMGYAMTLRPVSGAAGTYAARISWVDDGSDPDRVGGTSTIRLRGADAVWTWQGEPGQTLRMRGTLGQDGSLFFPRCYRLLEFASAASADVDCLFQEVPIR